MQIQVDFWNVGQGDASSIKICQNEFIFIDVGPKNSTLSQWLRLTQKHIKVKYIILTHNDSDHIGALNNILKIPHVEVSNILLLFDRPASKLQSLFRVAYEKYRNDELQLNRLEICDKSPKILWSNGELSLILKHPDMAENLYSSSCNDASAIISLKGAEKDLIIWGGDAFFGKVAKLNDPDSEILFGPHHGAPQDKDRATLKKNISNLQPKSCFISMGTNNSYNPHGVKSESCRI
ncbi:MAG: MBL fold metallo-hydrolase [Victivallaceae bacterium]|nr:MBL fold metallo-hydrolase [Victivallaceae bacterium]